MKILHIITSLGLGGAESVLYRLVANDKKNESVIISLTGHSYYSDLFKSIGVEVYHIDLKNNFLNPKDIFELIFLVKKVSPDIIQTWMYHANLIGGLVSFFFSRKKIYWNLRASFNTKTNTLNSNILFRISVFFSYILPFKIICCSKSVKINHEELGFNKKKMVTINNGYDINYLFDNKKLRQNQHLRFQFNDDMKIFGTAARFHPDKDFHNLLKSFCILKSKGIEKFRLLLVGENVTNQNIELTTLIKNFNLSEHVLLLGVQKNIVEFMNSIDIYVLSSKSEGFPNVLAEAMACKIPCITTNVGEAKDIVRDHGWVVPSQMPNLLADALSCAAFEIENKCKWQKRKDECRKIIVNNYSLSRMINNYNKIWSNFS
jgi:glycosyltransferase involved in cell wall biosynthesis